LSYLIRRLDANDLTRLREFWIENWGNDEMVSRGYVYHVEQLEGFVIEARNQWIGLVTYCIQQDECELVSIDSLQEGKGIGSQLVEAVIKQARQSNCTRLFLVTTNDNMNALRFYQKRGFELCALYRGAVHEARKIKPTIPTTGFDDIPLRDELELEIRFL